MHETSTQHVTNHALYNELYPEVNLEAHEARSREIRILQLQRRRTAVLETAGEHAARAWLSNAPALKATLFDAMMHPDCASAAARVAAALEAHKRVELRRLLQMAARAFLKPDGAWLVACLVVSGGAHASVVRLSI